MAKSRYHQLVSNTALFAFGNIGSKFIVFILMPLYTTALTTAEYGISELVVTGTNLLVPFVSVSIQDATLRYALDKNVDSGEVLKNTVFVLAIGSVVTCCLYPVISAYDAISDWSGFFVLIAILYMFRNALSVYLKSIDKVKLFAVDSIIYTLMLMLTNILCLVVLDMGLAGYFIAISLSTAVSIIFLIAFGRVISSVVHARMNRALLAEMVRFSLPMVLNNISWWVINASDKYMIEFFMDVGDAGIYSVAAKMPALLTTLTNIFNQAWIISSVTEYDTTRDSDFFSNTFSAFNCLLVLVTSAVILVIKPFMQVYVGSSFIECWKYVPLLLVGGIFQSYTAFFGAIYTSAKKNVSVMLTTFASALLNIALNLMLIPLMGIQGAVVSTAVSYFALFVFRMVNSQKYVKFEVRYTTVLISIAILVFQGIAVIALSDQVFLSIASLIALTAINWSSVKRLIAFGQKSLSKRNEANR